MLIIHEIGTYGVNSNRKLDIYMVEHQGGQMAGSAEKSPPEISYCLDINGRSEILFWTDWASFAREVNKLAPDLRQLQESVRWAGMISPQDILDPMESEPAMELGIVVEHKLACPNCGCRVMDHLEWLNDEVQCDPCGTIYTP